MPRVFISSTSVDLTDYREVASKMCNYLQLIPVGMEFFGATDNKPVDKCMQEVRNSDVYVGIFARRYGFIPPGETRSITEMEYDEATRAGIPRLCYVADSETIWDPSVIDGANEAKLDAFKRRIDADLVRDTFTDVNDFKFRLYHALSQLKGHPVEPADELSFEDDYSLMPPQPSLLIGREADLVEIKARFGIGRKREKQIVMRGWPGVGKTTLVNAIAYDKDILKQFPDGILWAALGENANPFAKMKEWGERLGGDVGTDLNTANQRLRTLLLKKRMLLIVDDVWQTEDGLPFKVAGTESSMLITTRFPSIANEFANQPGEIYVLEQLTDEMGFQLLTQLAPRVTQRYPTETRQLVADLEGLPLALRVAGRLLETESASGLDVLPLIDELRTNHKILMETVAPNDRNDPHTGITPTVGLLIQQSTRLLDETTRTYFAMLGVFAPKPATFDLEAMSAVWDNADALDVVRKLVDRGLLEYRNSNQRYLMHAVLVMHAKSLLDGEEQPDVATTTIGSTTTTNTDEIKRLQTSLKMLKTQLKMRPSLKSEIDEIERKIRRLGGDITTTSTPVAQPVTPPVSSSEPNPHQEELKRLRSRLKMLTTQLKGGNRNVQTEIQHIEDEIRRLGG